MIKIHSGIYKGMNINRINIDSTRETASMVREAVFNMVYNINGNILDLFAGSGSYGITALSLGVKFVSFNDSNYKAFKGLNDNINKLKISSLMYETKNLDYSDFLKSTKIKYDYIFLDPPYKFDDYHKLLESVSKVLTDKGVIILEVEKNTLIKIDDLDLEITKDKKYGIKRILIYTKKQIGL